jgi:hypothetical protein
MLIGAAGLLGGCGDDEDEPPTASTTSSQDPGAGEDAEPQPTTSAPVAADIEPLVATWYDSEENVYLVITEEGRVDDGDGLQWLAPGEQAMISATGEGTFVLTSNLSRQPEEFELSADGLELRTVGGADSYTKLD